MTKPPVRLPPTERQVEIWKFMLAHAIEHGVPPTIREIAKHFGMASSNAVSDHLKALHKKGLVRHYPGRSRAWVPCQ